jgi:predicted nucleotidyltransferase
MGTVEFRIGSDMYGLNTLNSDTDLMRIRFDEVDHVLPFPSIPDVFEWNNNNTKEYNLAFFMSLVAKGNPNTTEMLRLAYGRKSQTKEETFILHCMTSTHLFIHYNGISSNLLLAYDGHMRGVQKEMYSRGVTSKRLSHAYRVAYSLLESLETNKIVDFTRSRFREEVLSIKVKPEVDEWDVYVLDVLVTTLHDRVMSEAPNYKNGDYLKEYINGLFQDFYS